MIVYTHHSFVDKPPSPPKPPKVKYKRRLKLNNVVQFAKPPKVSKSRTLESERARKKAYYHKHKDEIKIRRLRKELSK